VNYFLTLWNALNENKKYGREFSCFFNVIYNDLLAIDSYIRRRLRVAMIHDHPSQNKGNKMNTKWGIEFFARIGLVPAFQYYYGKQYGHTIEDYIQYMKEKQEKKYKRALQKAKERGVEYFTPKRIQMINCAQGKLKHSM
jgi:hypothetical protein